MDTITSLMKLIKAARALAGASQDELAQEAGVSRQIVVRVEAADETVTVDAVEKVRAALERKSVVFIPSTADRGPGVALSKIGS
ncbi:helix-turn-helix transcriptional regulator [Ensifer sp. ENS02]|nr:helix-turn-helix transcriptional regulator [Ensifer sp. ENS02]